MNNGYNDDPAWARRGYDDIPPPPEGGGDDNVDRIPFNLIIPVGATKRILILDTVQFAFWEHDLWNITGKRDKVLCLKENGIDQRGCPVCKHVDKNGKSPYPSFIGYLTAIDMGTVTWEKGVAVLSPFISKKGKPIQFNRRLFGTKRGGSKKPGAMITLKRMAERRGGDLTGTVWDSHRPGEMDEACGTQFEYVDRWPQSEWKARLVELGANDKYIEKELVPIVYRDIFKPKSYDELQAIVDGRAPARSETNGNRNTGNGNRVEGAGYGSEGNEGGGEGGPRQGEDDIPF